MRFCNERLRSPASLPAGAGKPHSTCLSPACVKHNRLAYDIRIPLLLLFIPGGKHLTCRARIAVPLRLCAIPLISHE